MNVDEMICNLLWLLLDAAASKQNKSETLSCGYLVVVSKTTQESEQRNSVIVPAA